MIIGKRPKEDGVPSITFGRRPLKGADGLSPVERDYLKQVWPPKERLRVPSQLATTMATRAAAYLRKLPRLTIFGRSLLLLVGELLVNALFWIVAGLLFGRRDETHSLLNLCLLAWVSPRHGFRRSCPDYMHNAA